MLYTLQLPRERVCFTFLSVNVSCLLPTALSAKLLVPECSSNFSRSSRDALQGGGGDAQLRTFLPLLAEIDLERLICERHLASIVSS